MATTQEQITAERHRSADLLETLDEAQLSTESLCGGWTVRDVFGHELMPLVTPIAKIVVGMIKARGSFEKANDTLSRQVAQRPVADIATGLRQRARSSFHAPGFPLESALVDLIVHGQDIRRPLGLRRDFGPDVLRKALDFLTLPKAQPVFVARARLDGLSWNASDIEWTYGTGPSVTGPAEALIMVMAGRDVALDDVTGDGVATLRSR